MNQPVRVEVDLPCAVFEVLVARAEREGKSVAELIVEVVRVHLGRSEAPERVLAADDPLWTLVGAGEGTPDGSHAHDRLLYGGSAESE